MDQTSTYHPRQQHSTTYYHQILLAFIDALNTSKTDKATADLLNSRAILSPSGKPWSASAVKQALFKIRNYKEVPSRLHQALLQLCFDGSLRASQALILFAPRRQQGTM
jgi:hypothetical protein